MAIWATLAPSDAICIGFGPWSLPQHHRVLSDLRAHDWTNPTATSSTPVRFWTRTALLYVHGGVGTPSSPSELSPQHQTVPSLSLAQAWVELVSTSSTPRRGNEVASASTGCG